MTRLLKRSTNNNQLLRSLQLQFCFNKMRSLDDALTIETLSCELRSQYGLHLVGSFTNLARTGPVKSSSCVLAFQELRGASSLFSQL